MLTKLDKIIYEKMLDATVKKKSKTVTIELKDLYEMGYSEEDIVASADNLSKATIRDIHDA